MLAPIRSWLSHRTPAQQVAMVVALITTTGGILGATVQTAPSLLAEVRAWQHSNPSALPDQPVIVEGVAIGQAEPFVANVYPRPIALAKSPIDSMGSKIDLPPGKRAVGGQEVISLTIGNDSASSIIISNIDVAKDCQAPVGTHETLFFMPNGRWNRAKHGIYYNLNDPNPVAKKILKSGSVGSPYFFNHTVTLKPHKQHTFTIYVSSSRLFCQFVFNLKAATVSGARSIKVSDNGRPFLVAGLIHKRGRPCVDFSRYSIVYSSNPKGPPLHWQRADPAVRKLRAGCVGTGGAVHQAPLQKSRSGPAGTP
jgi:hypothetical protein